VLTMFGTSDSAILLLQLFSTISFCHRMQKLY
jgi:hypothetical protein